MRWTHESVRVSAAHAARGAAGVIGRHPGVAARFAVALLVGVALVVTLLLVIPAVIIGLLVLGAWQIVAAAREALRGPASPPDRLEGRRNVRVIDRSRDNAP